MTIYILLRMHPIIQIPLRMTSTIQIPLLKDATNHSDSFDNERNHSDAPENWAAMSRSHLTENAIKNLASSPDRATRNHQGFPEDASKCNHHCLH